jgi:hypothetical protein
MKKTLILVLIAAFLLTACMIMPGSRRHGREEVVLVPALPSVVILEAEPYYYSQGGYYYHYNKGRWYYSKSKRGSWIKLPKDRYPKQVRFKDKERKMYEDQHRGHEQPHDDEYDHHNRY